MPKCIDISLGTNLCRVVINNFLKVQNINIELVINSTIELFSNTDGAAMHVRTLVMTVNRYNCNDVYKLTSDMIYSNNG